MSDAFKMTLCVLSDLLRYNNIRLLEKTTLLFDHHTLLQSRVSNPQTTDKNITMMADMNAARSAFVKYVRYLAREEAHYLQMLNSQMITNNTPIPVRIEGTINPFFIDKALLASVSPQLARHCSAGKKLSIGHNAFRILTTWIVYRELESVEFGEPGWFCQGSLAEAWNLGTEYSIPALQNAAIQLIAEKFQHQDVDIIAVKEAYRATKRNTELRTILVSQHAKDCFINTGTAWDRGLIREHGMDKVPGFCMDLAMAFTAEMDHCENLNVDDFLVDETPVDEDSDSDSDESLTDG